MMSKYSGLNPWENGSLVMSKTAVFRMPAVSWDFGFMEVGTGVALSPNAFNVRLKPRNDSAATLRQQMLEAGTLTVDQLNWPTAQNREPGRDLVYQHSAQLFVRELLRLRGGPDALCATLALLPEHLNWQTAFLRGFESHFQRMLDVEKWWSLQIAQLQTRESSVLWSAGEARQRLEEILYTPLQVRLANEDLPHVTPVALQTVLNDWNFSQQSPLLQNKLNQLRAARVRLTPELAALLKSDLFREGIDGEAVLWATRRLAARDEPRKLLLVLSDGSPMDSATSLANDPHYLDHHLRDVVQAVESAGAVEIFGVGVGLDLSPYYSRSHVLDLEAASGNELLRELVAMIGGRARR